MTTERIVSSYVINERNKKGGGGREWISILLVVKNERGAGFYRYNLSISLDKEGITWHRGHSLATPLNIFGTKWWQFKSPRKYVFIPH